MRFDEFVKNASFALSEGSVYERLRRHPSIEFDPYIFHASLIYDDKSVRILEGVHREYIDVAQKHRLPILILTDTWRANQERINSSKFKKNFVFDKNLILHYIFLIFSDLTLKFNSNPALNFITNC